MNLENENNRTVPSIPGEIRLFAKIKNEANRIGFFLKYYRALGVNRFFFIDNGSSDGSTELLQDEPEVHLFSTAEPLHLHPVWLNHLLGKFGLGHWCMVVDLDELFVVPLMEPGNLRLLIGYLERHSFNAVEARLLDMYSDRPLRDTMLDPGEDPRRLCRFFDPVDSESPHFGGVRKRVFGASPYLMKVPFFLFQRPMVAGVGMHNLTPHQPADVMATLLHFKFLSDFGARVKQAVLGEHYFESSAEYKLYQKGLEKGADSGMRLPSSVEYRGDPRGLIEGGHQAVSGRYAEYMGFHEPFRKPGRCT